MKREPKPPKFKKTVLPNGLTLVTESYPGFRSLSIGVWAKVGTRHERPNEAGISHFLEHMLFKGTENRSSLQIAREIEQRGGEFNAFTAREYTCFHLLTLDRDLGLGMDILGDVLLHSLFDAEEIARERDVILQEIAMVEESPEELVHDIYFELSYGSHGLGRNILGSAASVKRMRRADLLRYFRRHYRPENLIVAVAGDVSHEAVLKKVTPWTRGPWPGVKKGTKPKRLLAAQGDFEPAPPVRYGTWWIERPTEQVHLVWGVEGPKYNHPDRFAAFLLNVYLGGGMSSSLFQEVREKNGLAYTVYSSLSPFLDSGLFSIYAATGMGQVPLCLKLIEQCVEQLSRELLPKAEIEIIQENLKGTVLLSADSVESRMTSIARNEIFFGEYTSVEEVCALIDAVKPEDIRRVARNLLGHGKRSIVALGPKPSKAIITKLRPELPRRYCRT